MNVTIAETLKKEINQFANIQKLAFFPLYEKYKDKRNPYFVTSNDILLLLSKSDCKLFSIFCDDIFCGGIVITKQDEQTYYLKRIFVNPSLQNFGIAQKAILAVEKNFSHAKKWVVDFPCDLLPNKKVYEKCGYIDTAKQIIINEKLTLSLYEKILN